MGNHQLIKSATNKTNKRTDRPSSSVLSPLSSLQKDLISSQGWSDQERKLSASSEKWPGEGGK